MTQPEWLEVTEIMLLRKALEQAETLCETLDHCEFIEPIDFDSEYDANRCRRAIEKRLNFKEAALLRTTHNANGHRKSFAI